MTSFPEQWDDGTDPTGPGHQVHWYDDRTVIIRQALRTNFEGPFIYLLLGSERALLLDTGTGDAKLRPVVDGLLSGQRLIVAHTHSHGDHVAGDTQFTGKPNTTVVVLSTGEHIAPWPRGQVNGLARPAR